MGRSGGSYKDTYVPTPEEIRAAKEAIRLERFLHRSTYSDPQKAVPYIKKEHRLRGYGRGGVHTGD